MNVLKVGKAMTRVAHPILWPMDILEKPVSYLMLMLLFFNQYKEFCCMPTSWKTAMTMLIHKKRKHNLNN